MTKSNLLDAIAERPLLSDGAMGTQLQLAGLEPGGCGESWNVESPQKIFAIQKAYVDAGSDCLLTNTFGGCRIMLARHGSAERVAELNQAAIEIALRAFAGRDGFVIGDIGPFGGIMEPLGEVPQEDVRQAFREQAKALVDGGVDAIIVETQTSLEELGFGIEAAREAGAPCIIGSMAFDMTFDGTDMRTMMGVGPEQAAEFMQENGAHIVALNCGTRIDMKSAQELVQRYRSTCDLPIMVQPNAGQPELENMKVVYNEPPESMAVGVPGLLEAGARIIGGCCGSTPDHIRAIREALDAEEAVRDQGAGG